MRTQGAGDIYHRNFPNCDPAVENQPKEDYIRGETKKSLMRERSLKKRALGYLSRILGLCMTLGAASSARPQDAAKLTVDWNQTVRVTKTTPTLQVVVNPPLRRGTRV